jgi:anti-sigma B factor antagonist
MTAGLTIETSERDGALVLAVRGELDIATADQLDQALARALDTDAATIEVDIDGVGFIDSTGLHVLMRHAATTGSRPRLRLTGGSPQARRLFQITGAVDILPFLSTPS